jgi:hypothetical protein
MPSGICWNNDFPEPDAIPGAKVSENEPMLGTDRERRCVGEPKEAVVKGHGREPDQVPPSAFQKGQSV